MAWRPNRSTVTISIIDSFEDQNLDEYTGDTADFSIVSDQNSPAGAVQDGTYALEKTQNGSFSDLSNDADSQTALNDYPTEGDTFRQYFYTEDSSTRFIWRWGSSSSEDVWWELAYQGDGTADMTLVNTGGNDAATHAGFSISTDTSYYMHVEWDDGTMGGTQGDIRAQLFQTSDDSAVSNELSFNDPPTGTSNFIRFSIDGMATAGNRAYYDWFHIRS